MSQDNNQTPVKPKKEGLMEVKNELVNTISSSEERAFPANYAALSNLNISWLYMLGIKDKDGNSVLMSCTPKSVQRSFLEMLYSGLSVVKKQCYLIPYGGELTFVSSYAGDELKAKRDGGVLSVIASAIYEGDKFAYEVEAESGIKRIKEHEQSLDTIGNGTKIKGAYCVVTFKDGRRELTIMSKDQIIMSWNQRQGQGLSPAHQKFTDEMACKTVKRRALKPIIGSSNDSSLMEEGNESPKGSEAAQAVKQKANAERFDFDEHEEISSKPTAEPKAVAAEVVQAESPSFA
jgi:recombination protein RecT